MSKYCCIHVLTVYNSLPIKLFTENTWAKCNEALSIRKTYNFKYNDNDNDNVLPSRVDSVHGYHPLCYKNFTGATNPKNKNNSSCEEESDSD